jgi:hypothetical protein
MKNVMRSGKSIIYRVLVCFAFVLVAGRGFCFTAEVLSLSNQEYFPATQRAISEAKESIFVVMYLISLDRQNKSSRVFQLMDELARAKLRGVEVKVILDYQSSSGITLGQTSYEAFRFLKDKGIEAYFDSAAVYTHNKAIVIDKRIVISGSHNWSDSALERNNETSFLIDSPELARQLLDEFSRIKLSGRELEEGLGVNIPYWAMEKHGVVQEMLRRHDERGFDTWLLLLRDLEGNAEGGVYPVRNTESIKEENKISNGVNTNYEVLAEGLGLLKDMDRIAYRRQINRLLRRLSRLYKLVEAKTQFKQPFKVRLLGKAEEDGFRIPRAYWDYGWASRLNLNAKVCLLINLAELGQRQPQEWMMTQQQITEKYGMHRYTVYLGMKALRDFNIVDVQYGEINKGYEERMPAVFRFLGLYDMREFEEELRQIESAYGRDLVGRARDYAFVVYKGFDLDSIKKVVSLINRYGEDKVDEAFKTVEMKNPDNPKRTLGYVIGILARMKFNP